jgi:hypothetical protein
VALFYGNIFISAALILIYLHYKLRVLMMTNLCEIGRSSFKVIIQYLYRCSVEGKLRTISIYTYITYATAMFNTTTYLKVSAAFQGTHSTNFELFIPSNIELVFTSSSYMVSMVTVVIIRANVPMLRLSGEVISRLKKDTDDL